MWAGSRYIVIMSVAAVIALVRGFIVSGILDLQSFGHYATIVAAAMFSSALVSFGEVERTIKAFPRLWVEEQNRYFVVNTADRSAWIMIRRALTFSILFLLCTFVEEISSIAYAGLFVALIALNAALASLYASAIRATGDVELLAQNTLLRAITVLIFGLSGAYYFGWQGAILGEVAGTIVGILLTRHAVIGKMSFLVENRKSLPKNDDFTLVDNGLWLFFAGLLASFPVYLDRVFVASVFGAVTVGTFAFLLLFVTGANTFAGIIAQLVGPKLVKMQHLGESVNAQVAYAGRWIALISVVGIVGMTVATCSLIFGPAQYFFEKFHLNLDLIFVTAVMCLLQVGVLLDYVLISRNQERVIFISAFSYTLIIGLAVLFVLSLKLSLVEFMWILVAGKSVHLAIQIVFIGLIWHTHKQQMPGVR